MKRITISLVLAVFLAALSACGGGGSGGACPTVEPTSCVTGLSGDWSVTDTIHTSSDYCSASDGFINPYTVGVTQVGCAITVDTPVGTFHGFVDGNTLCWSGSYAFEGGTTTITGMTIQSNDPPTTFDGSSNWTWTDGVGNCEGSTTTTGTKS